MASAGMAGFHAAMAANASNEPEDRSAGNAGSTGGLLAPERIIGVSSAVHQRKNSVLSVCHHVGKIGTRLI
jgi:hypothetical protein